jgi:cytidylate kinase
MPVLSTGITETSHAGTLKLRGSNSEVVQPRRREPIVICISGLSGCGKSTVAREIAKSFDLRYFSGGDALKALASEAGYNSSAVGWWESDEGIKFLEERTRDKLYDRRVDDKLREFAERGDVVLDSWTMPWLLNKGFKIWLEASPERRAIRITKRNKISLDAALQMLRQKDAKTKQLFKELYGFSLGEDFSPFDLVVDVNQMDSDQVFTTLRLAIERLFLEKC